MLLRWLKRAAPVAFLALVPSLFAYLVSSTNIGPRGAAYLNDPDWCYLFNGLRVATGKGVYALGHPGIPLQLVSGILLWIKSHLFPIGNADFVEEVLLHSEYYHNYLGNCVLLLNSISLFLFGFFLHRWKFSWAIVLGTQLSFLCFYQLLHFSGRILPEGLVVTIGVFVGLLWLNSLRAENKDRPLLLGSALGILTSLKFTIAPYLLLLVIPKGRKGKLVAIVSMGFFFLFFLLFLDPLQRQTFYTYYQNMILNTGSYGGGKPGFPDLQNAFSAIRELWKTERKNCIDLLFAGASMLLLMLRAYFWQRPKIFLLMALPLFIVTLNLVLVLKFSATRYLLPSLVLLPAYFAAFTQFEPNSRMRWLPFMALGVFFLVNQESYFKERANLRQTKEFLATWQETSEQILGQRKDCAILLMESVNLKVWADMVGDASAGGAFTPRLLQIYPHTWTLSLYNSHYSTFGSVAPLSEFDSILKSYPCAYFVTRRWFGDERQRQLFPWLKWDTLHSNRESEILFAEIPLNLRKKQEE